MSLSRHACLALFVCLPALAWPQQSPAPAAAAEQPKATSSSAPRAPALVVRPAPAPRTPGGRIHLDVVVTDKSGKPVSGLELKDFTLLDDNQPGKILSFQAFGGGVQQTNPPVEVILVLDTVNLPFLTVSVARGQIANFLLQNGGHLAEPVSLFVLTEKGVDAQRRPSLDGNALAVEVNKVDNQLRTIGRSAGFWGATERFQASLEMFSAIAENEAKKPDRKLLIWAGSGWPLFDSLRIETTFKQRQQYFDALVRLSTELREARISIYSVSLGQPGLNSFLYENFLKGVTTAAKMNLPNLGLKVFAVRSGGAVLGPDNDMTAQIDRCIQDAGAFYTISFDPPQADRANEYHDLKVLVDRPELKARTNTGYYNQP